MAAPGRIVTVAQQKGGSGKTTLAAGLAIAARGRGLSVALIDTDPQGSLGRWFMERLQSRGEDAALGFATASAWGAGYEAEKLARGADLVLIDTPPKIEGDLRPALRAADLVLVPVATSQVDLWATEGVLDLAGRERKPCLVVLNRARPGTRLSAEITAAAAGLGAALAGVQIGNRVAHAEAMGRDLAAGDGPAHGAARVELEALLEEVLAAAGG